MYRRLDGTRIVETLDHLQRRIEQRFPGSGLSQVSGELGVAARESINRAAHLSRAALARYLDYCTDLLSLTSKVAALYVEHLQDPVVLGAVNDVENLTTGLSRKIWQKITILDTAAP